MGACSGVVPKTYLAQLSRVLREALVRTREQLQGTDDHRRRDRSAVRDRPDLLAPRTFPASSSGSKSARTSGLRSRREPMPRSPGRRSCSISRPRPSPSAAPRTGCFTAVRCRHARSAPMPYSASGYGESTTDLAWDGQGMVHELGELMVESVRFDRAAELCITDVDTRRILNERMRTGHLQRCRRGCRTPRRQLSPHRLHSPLSRRRHRAGAPGAPFPLRATTAPISPRR